MFADNYEWYEVEPDDEYIYCCEEDWALNGDPEYDWAVVKYESDPGSGMWSCWWTSVDNMMCFGETDCDTKEEAMERVIDTYKEYTD